MYNRDAPRSQGWETILRRISPVQLPFIPAGFPSVKTWRSATDFSTLNLILAHLFSGKLQDELICASRSCNVEEVVLTFNHCVHATCTAKAPRLYNLCTKSFQDAESKHWSYCIDDRSINQIESTQCDSGLPQNLSVAARRFSADRNTSLQTENIFLA